MLGLGIPGYGDDYLKKTHMKERRKEIVISHSAILHSSFSVHIHIYNVISVCSLYTFMVPIGKEDGGNDSMVPFE